MFVQRFLNWSVTASVDQRATAIENLAAVFIEGSVAEGDLKPTERILTLFLDDPSTKVRRRMATALAKGDNVPRALIWSLMQDVSEVACEIYAASPTLRSADFVHAAEHCDSLIQTAVAQRHDLTADAARSLVSHGAENAITVLLKNKSITLSPALKHDIANSFGDNNSIRNALLNDQSLLPTTRQLLVTKLSDCLLNIVDQNDWAPKARVSAAANDARNTVTHEIAMDAEAQQIGAYVEHLRQTAQLTPALLVRTICLGNMALFEAAIATLSGASLNRVCSIVGEGRIRSFKALYTKTNLPVSAYPVFAAAITAWQNNDDAFQVVSAIIEDVSDDQTVDCAIIAMLSRMETELHRKGMQAVQQPRLAAA